MPDPANPAAPRARTGPAAKARTEALSPYVPGLHAAVEAELRAVLGLPAAAPMQWRAVAAGPGAIGRFEIAIGDGDDPLRIDLGDSLDRGAAWLAGTPLSLSYRRGAGGADPMQEPTGHAILSALRRRVAALNARPDGSTGLREATATLHRFAGVDDYMFRKISHSAWGPYGVLRLGFRCSQDCHFCWQSREWPEPPHEVYARWLDELAAADIRRLFISGGEPTLHPALPALIRRAARDHGMTVILETNAIRMRRMGYVDELVDCGLAGIFASLHSADPELSDALTRARGTHRGTVAGIANCLDRGLEVELNCVIQRRNAAGIGELARFVARELVAPARASSVRTMVFSQPTGAFDPAFDADAMVPLDELRGPLLEAAAVLRAAGVAMQGVGSCGFPLCLFRDAPELLDRNERERFDTMDVAGRAYVPACERCAMRAACLGVRSEYVAAFGDRGIVPFAQELA